MTALYIIFGLSVVALCVLFFFVLKGANKQTGGFQKQIKAPKVKKVEKTREEKSREKAELKAAIEDPSNSSSVYHGSDVAFVTDGTNWKFSPDCGLANVTNDPGYGEHQLFQLKKV